MPGRIAAKGGFSGRILPDFIGESVAVDAFK
jgi:hypothetical protein